VATFRDMHRSYRWDGIHSRVLGWIRLCSHCCRGNHFIFIVHWT